VSSPKCLGLTESDESTIDNIAYFGLDTAGVGGYITGARLREGLWASTNLRKEATGGCSRGAQTPV